MSLLYFARHGESEANRLRVFSNRDLPHGLTDVGRVQMEHLGERLRHIPFVAFYASPILRARQSAAILSACLGVPYDVTPALSEIDMGILEGTSAPAGWRDQDALLDRWLVDCEMHAKIEGGESLEDVHRRFRPLIQGLKTGRAADPVLLLGHGSMFMCALPSVLSNVACSFARQHVLGHGEVVVARIESDEIRCVSWGGMHLESPAGRFT
jgi:probable phosphoglycerate mutase